MAADIETLMRLQEGWREPTPLPEPQHPAIFRQKRIFRDMAAQVLQTAWLATVSDEMSPTQALTDYMRSLQDHFGIENCHRVAAFHGLSGSTYTDDRLRVITRLDFPDRKSVV